MLVYANDRVEKKTTVSLNSLKSQQEVLHEIILELTRNKLNTCKFVVCKKKINTKNLYYAF